MDNTMNMKNVSKEIIKPENYINNNDPLKRYNKTLFILAIISSLIGIGGGPLGMLIAILFFGTAIYVAGRVYISTFHIIKIKRITFPINGNVSKEQIKQYLLQNFQCNNDVSLEDNNSDIVFLFRDSAKIKIAFDKNQYKVVPIQTLKIRLRHAGKGSSVRLYKDTMKVVPYIIYIINNAINEITKGKLA